MVSNQLTSISNRSRQIATLQWSYLFLRNSFKLANRIFLFGQYLGTKQDKLFQIAKSSEKGFGKTAVIPLNVRFHVKTVH